MASAANSSSMLAKTQRSTMLPKRSPPSSPPTSMSATGSLKLPDAQRIPMSEPAQPSGVSQNYPTSEAVAVASLAPSVPKAEIGAPTGGLM